VVEVVFVAEDVVVLVAVLVVAVVNVVV